MKIAIYSRDSSNYGILVIIEQLIRSCNKYGVECRQICSLTEGNHDETIIPYGVLEAMEMLKHKGNVPMAFLIDAISLGAWNKFVVYTKTGYIFHKDYIKTLLQFFRWYYYDSYVAKHVKNIMLVSECDGNYLKKIKSDSNIIVCPNGVINNAHIKEKQPSQNLRMGILSSFLSPTAIYENGWFIYKYFRKYAKENPNVELVLAGRGKYIEVFANEPNVRILGEVDDLADFFKEIDVFIGANAKGCGILNRVLDAFTYQVPVIGHKNAFTGFGDMHESFLPFENYKSFTTVIDKLMNGEINSEEMVVNASLQIERYYNWDKNYNKLVETILNILR